MKNYLSVGSAFTDNDEKKAKLEKAISQIEWHESKNGKVTLGFMQGSGLKSFINEFGCNVSKFGYAGYYDKQNDISGGFIYGIENNYSDGDVKRVIVYAIDNGVQLIPVLVDEEGQSPVIAVAEPITKDNWDTGETEIDPAGGYGLQSHQ